MRHDAAAVRFPPPLVFLAALLGGIALGHFVPAPVPRAVSFAGIAVAACGVGLVVSARILFLRTKQCPTPWSPTPELILRGPYRFTRNPMYVGIATFLVGLGLAVDDVWISLCALPALAIVHVIAVQKEEAYLAAKFGDAYASYTARVRRYL